jgi:DHA2 family multidrug resistance protein
MSTFFVSMISISIDGIPPERIPAASGVSNFTRITAGGFAASIVTTMWDRREAFHQSRQVEIPTATNPQFHAALANLHAHGFGVAQSYGVFMGNIIRQSYFLASLDIFWLSAWICLALLGVVWLVKRSMANGAVAAAD